MIRPLVLPVAALLLCSCASHRLVVPNPNPSGPEQSVRSTSFGGVTRRTEVACPTNLIDEVRVRQSFGDSLITVLTLGLVAPTRIDYRCAKEPTAEGTTGN